MHLFSLEKMSLLINTIFIIFLKKVFQICLFAEWKKSNSKWSASFTMNLTDLQIQFSKQGSIFSIYRKAKF